MVISTLSRASCRRWEIMVYKASQCSLKSYLVSIRASVTKPFWSDCPVRLPHDHQVFHHAQEIVSCYDAFFCTATDSSRYVSIENFNSCFHRRIKTKISKLAPSSSSEILTVLKHLTILLSNVHMLHIKCHTLNVL